MSIFYVAIAEKPAFLPMDRYEAEKFLYDLELDAPDAEYELELVNNTDFLLVLDSNFRAFNRLAQRIEGMGKDDRERLQAWCDAQGTCTVEDALKASGHMNAVMFLHGVDSDEILGEFALENGMILEYNDLPDEVYEALDKAKAGAKLREMEGGVFVNGGYLINEDFSDEPIPAEEPLAYFQVRFSDEHHDSGWCDVPLTEADGRLITRMFSCEDLSELAMENRSIVPQLNGMISGADELPELNLLREALNDMSGAELQKYKALLEVVQPSAPSAAGENPDRARGDRILAAVPERGNWRAVAGRLADTRPNRRYATWHHRRGSKSARGLRQWFHRQASGLRILWRASN